MFYYIYWLILIYLKLYFEFKKVPFYHAGWGIYYNFDLKKKGKQKLSIKHQSIKDQILKISKKRWIFNIKLPFATLNDLWGHTSFYDKFVSFLMLAFIDFLTKISS